MKNTGISKRPGWNEYFMSVTHLLSTRSTCLRRKVGAVIVKDKRILATGYNGVPQGIKHCSETGCLREKLNIPSGERQEICRGLHAEQNAIIQASRFGISIKDSVLYCTHQPCVTCAKMLINAGVGEIIFSGDYPDKFAVNMLKEAKVKITVFKGIEA
jgi:dCMP deaminase